MKVCGVITEYNPFHNGHKYQLDTIKKETCCDYIIAIMSGDFVQRGEPAIVDKYTRTKMALLNGADLVLELPVVYSTSSAEFFANAGVSILRKTGVASTLCYGVETVFPKLADAISHILLEQPEAYRNALCSYQRSGKSFPAARSLAVADSLSTNDAYDFSLDDITSFMSSPNNILALEYEKSLRRTDIIGYPIQRIGEGYHSTCQSSSLASATAIRNILYDQSIVSTLSHMMPPECAELILTLLNSERLVFCDDISDMLYYKLLSLRDFGFESFLDCNPQLSAKITKNIKAFSSFTQFCELLKSKDITYTRISRVLIHILLDIKKEDIVDSPSYLRVLGFKKSSAPLLHEIKKRASAPLITKVADAPYELIAKDIYASDIYARLQHKADKPYNEYTHGPVII